MKEEKNTFATACRRIFEKPVVFSADLIVQKSYMDVPMEKKCRKIHVEKHTHTDTHIHKNQKELRKKYQHSNASVVEVPIKPIITL